MLRRQRKQAAEGSRGGPHDPKTGTVEVPAVQPETGAPGGGATPESAPAMAKEGADESWTMLSAHPETSSQLAAPAPTQQRRPLGQHVVTAGYNGGTPPRPLSPGARHRRHALPRSASAHVLGRVADSTAEAVATTSASRHRARPLRRPQTASARAQAARHPHRRSPSLPGGDGTVATWSMDTEALIETANATKEAVQQRTADAVPQPASEASEGPEQQQPADHGAATGVDDDDKPVAREVQL